MDAPYAYHKLARPLVDKLRRASTDVEIHRALANYSWLSSVGRITVTCLILAWGGFMTKEYLKSQSTQQLERYNSIGKLWIGTDPNGLLWLLFKVWALSLILSAGLAVLNRFRAL